MEIMSFFSSFDPSVIMDKIFFFFGIFLIFLVVGGAGMFIWYIKTREKNKKYLKTVGWWEEVSGTGRLEPTRMDKVEEIVIPGTTLRVFYCKARNLWLPRFSRGITKDLYYVAMTPKQQMVNFTIRGLSSDLKSADLEHDHTDMLWAAENTREFIKRNYRDKSVKWWQAYQGVITTTIYIMVMTFSLVLIIYFLRGIVEDLSTLSGSIAESVKTACQNSATSGIIQK